MTQPPDLSGAVLLNGSGSRRYSVTLNREWESMLKFLAAAYGGTEGDILQRIALNGVQVSFVQVVGQCAQKALEAARDMLYAS